jgi:hypothetical protein
VWFYVKFEVLKALKKCIFLFLAFDVVYAKNRDSLLVQNVGNKISDYTAPHIRRHLIKFIFSEHGALHVRKTQRIASVQMCVQLNTRYSHQCL